MSASYNARAEAGKDEPTSKVRKPTGRPDKPDPDFPLHAHALGYWSKKINKKIVHFGRWGRVVKGKLVHLPYEPAWKEAKAAYDKFKVAAENGELNGFVVCRDDELPVTQKEVLVKHVCNDFYNAKLTLKKKGKLEASTLTEYEAVTDMIVEQFKGDTPVASLTAKDFENLRSYMADRWGPNRLKCTLGRVKAVFKYAYEIELIPAPIPCLQPNSAIFAPPSKADIRKSKKKHERVHGKNLFTVAECRKMIESAPSPVKAMILLGLNAGFGNKDCATLYLGALDLEAGWMEYPRPKTGVDRRCPLWPETVEALRAVLAARPKPRNADCEDKVFLRRNGRSWLYFDRANAITVLFRKVMDQAEVHRKGLGFYTLRRTFRTVADATLDFPAVRMIMGHADDSIDDVYRKSIDDARLLKVTNHVHDCIFGTTEGGAE